MEPVKWGIIGPGSIAREFVSDLAFVKTPQEVVAVLGNSKDSTMEFAGTFNIPHVFFELDEFIAKGNMNVVYVATPHTLHHGQVMKCLQHRIPVLCEKPLTINETQCKELVDAAISAQTFLMEGMWIRFLPGIRLVMSLLKEGKLGEIVSIKASMGYKAPPDPDSRYFDPALGGGSLLDLGVYPVFLALLLLGAPDTIKAVGTLSEKGIDETCSILFHYNKGQHATLESSLKSETKLPVEIAGEKGTIKILYPWFEKTPGIELQLYNEAPVTYPIQWEGHGLYFETEEVLSCIQNKQIESKLLSHAFSIEMIKIMDEIRSQVNVSYTMHE
ncbi:Gfo/Idh/MocA family protein [Agriterribacter humi]|jgi:predicted dehydrogenase|uniref:Gfo/Idh/MocA family protein n=1 Tax=Agriterribacter humi TaxID=1104781 RepID=UPI001264F0D1|nr:Gfo/Idh/MocA family oxidoreductase [Agriterribacter humi]